MWYFHNADINSIYIPGQVCLLQVPTSVGSPRLHNFGSKTRLVSKVFSFARGNKARLPYESMVLFVHCAFFGGKSDSLQSLSLFLFPPPQEAEQSDLKIFQKLVKNSIGWRDFPFFTFCLDTKLKIFYEKMVQSINCAFPNSKLLISVF